MSKTQEVDYADFVGRLAKPGSAILATLAPGEAHAIHMIMGVCGEAGELLDAIKKSAIYKKPIDMQNVIEELGDIEFYLQGLRNGFQITREEVIEKNVAKLSKRYPAGYTNKAAIERADKA